MRDPTSEKAKPLAATGATLFAFDFSQASTFANIPRNAQAVFVNTPGDINRTQLTIAGIDAAKAAAVRVLVSSLATLICCRRSMWL